VGGGAKQATQ
ncbi:hypothetical protein VCHC62B1_3703B, partial [Vibrio cholerae HC-62B1]